MLLFFVNMSQSYAWEGMPMPALHVEGRYLKDDAGTIVNLHGFAQTYSPYFNNNAWGNYDVNACLKYNKGLIDKMLAAGWKVNFIRMHLDPYWSNLPNCSGRYEGEECFIETRFKYYLDNVFIPMAEYCVSKGLYVLMRPPGVFPEKIQVGDVYNNYLIKVWGIVGMHPKLKNHPNIMYELGNEPIDILGTDGTYGATGDPKFENLKKYMQPIVDTIRHAGSDNILWVPGLGYQSCYTGYTKYPIEGSNIGYAIHLYPGWFGSADGYQVFQREWDKSIMPIADIAPIMVTEMDWAPEKYNASWGKSYTGTTGADGFGANFKYITDNSGNVSWLIFTDALKLAQFVDTKPAQGADTTFLTDPEACPWPAYHWYQEYANPTTGTLKTFEVLSTDLLPIGEENVTLLTGSNTYIFAKATYTDDRTEYVSSKATYTSNNAAVATGAAGRLIAHKDGTATVTVGFQGQEKQINVTASTFPLLAECMDLTMFGVNTFNNTTHTLSLCQYGQAGWSFVNGVDLSAYKYLVFKFGNYNYPWGTHIRVKNGDTESTEYKWEGSKQLVINLKTMITDGGLSLAASHITAVRFWSAGGDYVISKVYLTNNNNYTEPTGIEDVSVKQPSGNDLVDVYSLIGFRIRTQVKRSEATLGLTRGLYMVGSEKVIVVK